MTVRGRNWALLANPNRYRIEDAVRALDSDWWVVEGHAVRRGDRVLIWKAQGRKTIKSRGVVALGEVVSDPEARADAGNNFWVDPSEATVVRERVQVRYLVPRGLPLWMGGEHDELLARLSVSRSTGGSVFRIPDEDWERLARVAGVGPFDVDRVESIPIEQHLTETMVQQARQEPIDVARREAELIHRYLACLEGRGTLACRQRIQPADDVQALFTDLFDADRNVLVEAKGSANRDAIRMAIGQLLDYSRFLRPAPRLAVLLPSRPSEDLCRLLTKCDIALIYATLDGFNEPGSADESDVKESRGIGHQEP